MSFCKPEAWQVSEDRYQPELNDYFDIVFALSNGYFGVRGTPEEGFSGKNARPGTYLAHVYEQFPVAYAWRRTGFAEKYDSVVRCLDWTGIRLTIAGTPFDPQAGRVMEYSRVLDLQQGTLTRRLVWESPKKQQTLIESVRFVSRQHLHVGGIRFAFQPLNYTARVTLSAGLAGCADEEAWHPAEGSAVAGDGALLVQRTKVTGITVAAAMRAALSADGRALKAVARFGGGERGVTRTFAFQARRGVRYELDKLVAFCNSRDAEEGAPGKRACAEAAKARAAGLGRLLDRHTAGWRAVWRDRDVRIEGDPAAQQGIRFSMFQMEQCYSGRDASLNIGPRALTSTGHGGLYFWDTEIYMLPYYAYNAPRLARTLLQYRHRTLPQARARAELFGCRGAMYPWSTIDGQECATPWEYALLQIHVTGAIPYAVWVYMQATEDTPFLLKYGAELVIETCRFWASRSYLNPRTGECVINCVTGPDEYTVAVNNDVYTNALARFVLQYGVQVVRGLRSRHAAAWRALARRLKFDDAETRDWALRARRMRIPFDKELGIHPQHDAFLDMDPFDLKSFPDKWRPAWQNCPWDRIIRTQMVKQPDVLLAMLLLPDWFDPKAKRANFEFYDPKTIHESSLGACIHSIIAAEVGLAETAFSYYMRGSRLDLDTRRIDGIRIGNAAGSWLCLVNGFAGMRLHTRTGELSFDHHLPAQWEAMTFAMQYRGRRLRVRLERDAVVVALDGAPLAVRVGGKRVRLREGAEQRLPLAH